jgi:hypothetical protein
VEQRRPDDRFGLQAYAALAQLLPHRLLTVWVGSLPWFPTADNFPLLHPFRPMVSIPGVRSGTPIICGIRAMKPGSVTCISPW